MRFYRSTISALPERGEPSREIDPITATPGQGVKYTAVFEIYPTIALKPNN